MLYGQVTLHSRRQIKETNSEANLKEIFNYLSIKDVEYPTKEGLMQHKQLFGSIQQEGTVVSCARFRHFMKTLDMSDQEIDKLIKEGDMDGDGYIHYEELLAIMNAK